MPAARNPAINPAAPTAAITEAVERFRMDRAPTRITKRYNEISESTSLGRVFYMMPCQWFKFLLTARTVHVPEVQSKTKAAAKCRGLVKGRVTRSDESGHDRRGA